MLHLPSISFTWNKYEEENDTLSAVDNSLLLNSYNTNAKEVKQYLGNQLTELLIYRKKVTLVLVFVTKL